MVDCVARGRPPEVVAADPPKTMENPGTPGAERAPLGLDARSLGRDRRTERGVDADGELRVRWVETDDV